MSPLIGRKSNMPNFELLTPKALIERDRLIRQKKTLDEQFNKEVREISIKIPPRPLGECPKPLEDINAHNETVESLSYTGLADETRIIRVDAVTYKPKDKLARINQIEQWKKEDAAYTQATNYYSDAYREIEERIKGPEYKSIARSINILSKPHSDFVSQMMAKINTRQVPNLNSERRKILDSLKNNLRNSFNSSYTIDTDNVLQKLSQTQNELQKKRNFFSRFFFPKDDVYKQIEKLKSEFQYDQLKRQFAERIQAADESAKKIQDEREEKEPKQEQVKTQQKDEVKEAPSEKKESKDFTPTVIPGFYDQTDEDEVENKTSTFRM